MNTINRNDPGIYIHIPFCVRKCDYCDFLSFPADENTRERYVRALCREIRQWEMAFDERRVFSEDSASKKPAAEGRVFHDTVNDFVNTKSGKAVSVFLGGGTPSVLEADQICRILETVREKFALREEAETTVECNPGTLTAEKLTALKKAGVNRLSIGLQSADDRELKLLGRIHGRTDFEQNFRAARDAGFTNINVDLMSALPGQTLQDWKATLEYVTELDNPPEHISAYSLIVEENTPFYGRYHTSEDGNESSDGRDDMKGQEGRDNLNSRNIPNSRNDQDGQDAWDGRHGVSGIPEYDSLKRPSSENVYLVQLPSEEEERAMYHLTREFLSGRGFRQYEISNYAKPGYECIHNIGYWERRNYIGFGLGAASCVDNIRWKNTGNMQKYLEAFGETGPDVSVFASDTASRDMRTGTNIREDIVNLSSRDMRTGTNIREDIVSLSLRDQIEETVFLGLRMNEGIDLVRFEKEFGTAFHDLFRERITDLEVQGLVETANGHFRVTQKGMDLEGYVEERLLT